VDAKLARQVADGEITYTEAVRRGICRPLGEGDVDVTGAIGALNAVGYDGWYVLEQDTILDGPRVGGGPSSAVARSLSYLRNLS
jgi:inosose dehydratase